MDVFQLRNRLVDDDGSYIGSFIRIKDTRIEEVQQRLDEGLRRLDFDLLRVCWRS